MTQQKPESKAGQGGIKGLAISPTCQHTPFPPSWPSKIITVVQQAPSWDWDSFVLPYLTAPFQEPVSLPSVSWRHGVGDNRSLSHPRSQR